jgi:hypothetical protein
MGTENDKYDPTLDDFKNDLEAMSNIMKNCKNYDKRGLDSLLNNSSNCDEPYLSILFIT